MKHVCLVALPHAMSSSLALPAEMLQAVDNLMLLNQRQHAVRTQIVGLQRGPVQTAGNLPLSVDHTFSQVRQCDLIILPTRWRHAVQALPRSAVFYRWLQQRYADGATLCAVGTGSFVLAEAGLLSSRPATTHWQFFELFAQRYPDIELKRNYLLTEAERLFCAGSINSIADLMIHLIGQYWGEAIAHQVERQFSPEIRRPFHSHAFRVGQSDLHQDEAIAFVQSWLQKNYTEQTDNRQLADMAGLSPRSFQRRFKQASGKTPVQYLQDIRLQNGQELLRGSNLSVNDIALQLGFTDSSYFCRLFKRQMGQTPENYRRSVRGKLFSSDM